MKKWLVFFSVLTLFAGEKFVIGNPPTEGFFSSFCSALNNIIWAERNGKIPVVYWDRTFYHHQKGEWKGTHNAWEYYFEPVSPLSYERGDEVYRVYQAPDEFNLPMAFIKTPEAFDELRFEAKEAIDRYIKIKPEILEKVDSIYKEQLAGSVNIGIHLRGTDRALKNKTLMPKAMIEEAKTIAAEMGGMVRFFVATDEESFLNLAKKELPDMVYCDSKRSQTGKPIHGPHTLNGAVLGEEVLIEGLLLAKCDFLLHSMSSVPIAVMLLNPSIKSIYFNPYLYMHKD